MTKLLSVTLSLLVAVALVPVRTCDGQEVPVVRAAGEELVEVMLRQGGKTAAAELAEIGGETAVRAILEAAAKEGGEKLVSRVAYYAAQYGPAALKAIERSPLRMVRALDEVAPDLIRQAIRAAAREPDITARLVAIYGKDAIEVAAKHPGVGTIIADKLGADGLRIGQRLSTDEAIVLARHADEIASLPLGPRSQLLNAVNQAPSAVLDFLERHPKVLLTAGGVVAVIAAKDNLFGATAAPNGTAPGPGLADRLFTGVLNAFARPVSAIIMLLGCSLSGWVAIRLWSSWKLQRIRHELATANAEAKKALLLPGDRRTESPKTRR